ncbi:MAG: NAD(P)H-hydrate epimerase [Omnitrophica WOR_2 bacterium GWF2_38_59]|nr:MAG: NAD(P)H-hydrate epimerase [Omnitrophica WOR_2 bacterium GWF2_38_59]OGX46759.1 MAG: NAD(P)H-hydrate epimerase [Omnitrophica WOR_2 bacterium RIFOXYA2_FULL_38_17]OGX58852.1 MAG: NAD(P)H-hydrate epimerase [Omnitrophica WOR_2 bacterium RIFOXYC2_FULL_38_12]HBG61988.1 NAD(P)H-hydrate epimerase [Candidatus Omnitrophota bacterium]
MNKSSVTVKQVQKIDDIAINKYGIASIVLMENAGRAVSQEVKRMLPKNKKAKVVIVCGSGNNAGDGLVVARHLNEMDADVKIFMLGGSENLKNDAKINYEIARKLNIQATEVKSVNKAMIDEIKKADVTVDAIFGVGLNRDLAGTFYEAVEVINEFSKKVVSVDIPSGLDGTNGTVYGICVQADKTVTFSLPKKGLLCGQGIKFSGKVVVADIGIPKKIILKKDDD